MTHDCNGSSMMGSSYKIKPTNPVANAGNDKTCKGQQHWPPRLFKMGEDKYPADNRDEQAGEKPHQTVPIRDDQKAHVPHKRSDAAKSEQDVTKHKHQLLVGCVSKRDM